MYQNILVPVDGSTTSDLAIQEAPELARYQSKVRTVGTGARGRRYMRLWIANSYINYANEGNKKRVLATKY